METKILPVLPLRGLVVFPQMVIHFDVGREKSIKAIESAMEDNQLIILATQKQVADDDPETNNIFDVGTVARIKQILKLPENHCRVIAEGLYRVQIENYVEETEYFKCECEEIAEYVPDVDDPQVLALIRSVKNDFLEYFNLNRRMPPETISNIISVENPKELSDLISANIAIETSVKQELLSEIIVEERLKRLLSILHREIQILEIDKEINDRVKQEVDKHQREYYLHEQIKVIKDELGESDDINDEIEALKFKVLDLKLPEKYENKLLKDIKRLSQLNPQSPDTGVLRTYLDTVLELPWNTSSNEEIDIEKAEKILNDDHYGLDKVKERTLEFFAVKKLGGEANGAILCLVGPPGVGKTSIAKSIAKSLNRNYVKLSLGGVKDEAEIRGHRKTYIGSMPGRIISAVKNAGTNNPLILLDEIDKLGNDYKGDPTSAMLEVLDKEQNFEFTDHYLEIPFDLSKVVFIATANDISNVPAPLRDRMDIIELSSYTYEEKAQIALKYLIPKQLIRHNLKGVTIDKSAVTKMIYEYTREAGVRGLERLIENLCRKCAKVLVEGKQKSIKVSSFNLEKYLGIPKYKSDVLERVDQVGVVTGLAWTQVGGEILSIEVNIMEGNGKLELTGSLGDVMKESAKASLSYVRANYKKLQIPVDFYKKVDIHIHVPEGAVPKDGPSAGIAITTALVSALTGKTVKRNIAMTGEVTLRGRVLPIGGLKEKTLAALRYGIDTVIIPLENKKDLENVSELVKHEIKFIFADNVETVLNNALNNDTLYTYDIFNIIEKPNVVSTNKAIN